MHCGSGPLVLSASESGRLRYGEGIRGWGARRGGVPQLLTFLIKSADLISDSAV